MTPFRVTPLLFAVAAARCSSSFGNCNADGEEEEESVLLQTSKKAIGPLSLPSAPGEFKVLYVGAPRTGTQSMARALERLGYSPCHSGEHFGVRPTLCNYVFHNGTMDEVTEMMAEGGWDSGMDETFHLIYQGVRDRWPNSKFVLPLKEGEDWYQSCLHRLHEGNTLNPDECTAANYWGCDFFTTKAPLKDTKETCIANYNAHVERVKQVIPPDRLLLFNMSDGYAPLCDFLGKKVPTFPNGTAEPFPHEDKYTSD